MRLLTSIALGAVLPLALVAQEVDPAWPCVQRKVDHLSLAVMWPHPVPDDAAGLEPDFQAVAEQMALRRVSIEEVGTRVDELAADHPDIDADALGRLFAEAFRRIDRHRLQLIAGIGRYASGQQALSRETDALRSEFAELEAAAEPDFDRLDELEAEIDWRERIFDDRSAALTYVCETPVLLEKRAYEIAQLLLARID